MHRRTGPPSPPVRVEKTAGQKRRDDYSQPSLWIRITAQNYRLYPIHALLVQISCGESRKWSSNPHTVDCRLNQYKIIEKYIRCYESYYIDFELCKQKQPQQTVPCRTKPTAIIPKAQRATYPSVRLYKSISMECCCTEATSCHHIELKQLNLLKITSSSGKSSHLPTLNRAKTP